MQKIKGFSLLVISLAFLLAEIYYLIWEPIAMGVSFVPTARQYWAVAIPVFLGVLMAFGTIAYIGYTMITTKEPRRLGYQEAYELALEEEQGEN